MIRLRALPALAAVALAVLALAAAPESAMAQTSALVSNIGQATFTSSGLAHNSSAQGFTTGSNAAGYVLTDIDVRFTNAVNSSVSVQLATGLPSATTVVATLTNPATLGSGTFKFTAPDNTTLDADTEYWVVVSGGGNGSISVTSSNDEDAGAAAGWSIADNGYFRAASSSGAWSTSSSKRMIRVNGSEVAAGPDVSIAGGAAVTEGTDASFTLTVAEAPTDTVTVNLTVSEKAGSDYVAAANEGAKTVMIPAGDTTATYTVPTVGDSKDEPNGYVKVTVATGTGYGVGSPAADSVTVNDDDTNAVATGSPTITGFPQVGQTLTAATSGIADTDGLTSVSYSYQWIRTDSGTDTDIASATSSTYELVAADQGRTVKVKVSFTDDNGNDEELTSTATGAVIAAAPACDAGNAWCATLTVGEDATGGNAVTRRGYCSSSNDRCDTTFGSLADTEFTLSGTTYTVRSVRWGTATSNRLHFALDRDFPSTSLSTLKLKVDGHEFALSAASRANQGNDAAHNYWWTNQAAIKAYATGRRVTVQILQDQRPVLSLNAAGDDNTYHNGDTIRVTATWPQSVTVTGTPRIPVRIGSATRNANYATGSPGTAMEFRYVVGSSDTDTDGVSIAANALTLNGGTIRYSDNTDAERKHDAVDASTDHKVDGRGASVSTVAFTDLPSGSPIRSIGDSLKITVTFDRPVRVTGTPRIALSPAFGYNAATGLNDVTRHATYVSGSGTTALLFAYELQDRDQSSEFVSVGANALALNGGTIRTGTANATLTHAMASAGKRVDAARPTITDVEIITNTPDVDSDLDGDADTFVSGEAITVRVSFSHDLVLARMGHTNSPSIVLAIGSNDYTLNGGSVSLSRVTFPAYTVKTTDADTDGITIKRDASGNVVRLGGDATLKSPAILGSNDANLTLGADPKVEWRKSAADTVKSLNVRGTNAAPVASNFTVATPADVTKTFAVDDFTFTDDDGDPLKDVEIVTLPSAGGTLKLGTANVTANQTITRASITNLKFEPTTGFSGDATFTFKVVDSFGAKSTAAATATVTVGANVTLSFNSAGEDGIYGLGDHIDITATFAESVTVGTTGGRPRIPFTIGTTLKHATYQSGSPATALVFRYTVASGDEDTDGITVAANALELNGGTIRIGTTTTTASLDHDAAGANTARKVDGVRPAVNSLAVSSDAGTDRLYAIGDVIQFTATFSENVTVTSSGGEEETWPQIAFVLGTPEKQAVYTSGSGTTALVFSYTVAAGDADGNGIHVRANRLTLNGGAIADAAGNDATLTHSAVGSSTNHRVDGQVPTVNSVAVTSNAGSDRTYASGDAISLRVRFAENVTVASSGGGDPTWPRIALTIGTAEKYAVYHSGTGTRDIVFRYVVAPGDEDTDGIAVGANKLELNGGTIVDAVGNAATLAHTALGAQTNHRVDGERPTVSSVAVTSNAGPDSIYVAGDHIEFTATFSESVTVTGTPRIPFTVGSTTKHALYNRGSPGTAIVFRYTVASGDEDADGIAAAANALELNGGAIVDAVGNAATLDHAEVTANRSHRVDAVRPTVSGATLVGTEVRIEFSEALHTALPAASAFAVKLKGTEQNLAATNAVAISGSTVTLTLAAAPDTGSLTVDYEKPTGTSSILRDVAGNEVESFTDQSVSQAPTVVKATLQGQSVDITFSQELGSQVPGGLTGQFTVKLDGAVQALRTQSAISFTASGLKLILNAAPGAGAVTVSYAKPATGQLRGANNVAVESFTDYPVIRPATVSSATTTENGRGVEITFTKNLDDLPSALSNHTKVTVDGVDRSVRPLIIGGVLTLILDGEHTIQAGNTVTASYSQPATGRLRDPDGLAIASFTNHPVTNIVPAAFSSATTFVPPSPGDRASLVVLTFDFRLKGPDPVASAFTVTAGGTDITPTDALIVINDLNLTLPTTGRQIAAGETVTVSYAKPATGNKLMDNNDREVAEFTDQPVTNTVPLTVTGLEIISDPGPDKTYQGGDTIRVAMTFSAPATVTGTPRIKFKFRQAHVGTVTSPPHVNYESGSGMNRLVFAYEVSNVNDSGTEGIALPATRMDLNGGTIKAGDTDATLTYSAVGHDTNHRVHGPTARDTTAPAVSTTTTPTVNGATLVITFDEALDGTGTAPDSSAFTVKVGGTKVPLADTNPVAIAGSAVTLTLAEAVIDANSVTVAYDKPSANPIQDFTAGNDAATFGDQAVTNNTPGVAPTVLTDPAPVVGGTRLVITFSEPLSEQANSIPAASAFTVTVAGNSRNVTNVAVSGATVTLTLASAASFGETVTVGYTEPASHEPALRDRAPVANRVATFSGVAVTNNDATAPSYSSSAVVGAALTITFDENLDTSSEPAPAAFTVRVGGSNRGVSNVDISGADVTLTLASAVTPGQAVTVSYAKPAADPLQDGATNQVADFGPETVTNNTRAAVTAAPSVTSSPAPGDTYGLGEHIELTVTFSHRVTVTGTPQLEVAVGSNNRQAAYNRGSGSTSLVFRYTVVAADADTDGISVAADALTLNGGAIQDAGSGAATLTHDALGVQSGHKVDGTLTRTAVTIAGGAAVTEGGGAVFTLTASPAPPADITVNLTVSQSGNYVAPANLGAQTVTVPASGAATWTVPTVNDGTDEPNGSVTVRVDAGTGYTVGSPASASVTVNDNDTSAPPARPAFSRAAVSGTALTITFSRSLDAGSAPAGSAFTVTATPAGGSARTIAGTGTASVSGSTVTVALASAVASGETVRVAYARPSANPLRGAGSSGLEVSNFTGRSVANNTPSGPASPPPQGGGVSGGGATVTLTFADELDASSTPDPGDFTVTVAAASDTSNAASDAGSPAGSPAADDHYRVTAVSILGATLELTISPPVPEDREASVSYTPGTRPLRTTAGAAVPNFSVTVPAATPPPPPPPPPTPNRAPAFDVSEYAFELREHVDGSAEPVALGAVTAEDPDGDDLSYALAAGDGSRFAVESADGGVSYVGPGEDYETEPNVFELTVQARDPGGLSAEASVTVRIVNVVELPVAADDAVATDEDVAVTVDVLANDTDSEGAGLRVASVSEPANGTAEIAADGRGVLYTPAENWYGTDRFTYVAEDGNGATSEAAVEVTVRSVNDAPEAAADTASTDEDVALTVDVLANDTDIDGDSLRVASVSAPANGTAAVAADGRGVLYTPAENWHGTDAFTYEADDGYGGTASASVEVTVAPVNDLPVAVDDRATTNEDEAVTVDVLANDTDPDGDGLSLVSVSAPENGTARIAAGVVLYMPAANFSGTDRFTYEIEDDGGARASAAVEVTVLPTNDAPMPVGTIPAQSLEEGGDPARIELSPFFEDADGDVLAFGTVSSDSSVVRATVAGSVLTLVPAGYGRVVVVVAARDAGGLTATQAVAVGVSDGAARGMVSHALAGMARSHLASARMTLGRRPMASRSEASRLSLMGRDVPLSLDAAKSVAEQTWRGWLSGVSSRAMSYARPDSGSTGGSGDDPTLGDLFRFEDLAGQLTRFDGGRDPLRGSEFQFGFDVGGGGGGQEAGGGGGGLRLQLWGQGDVQTFRGAPADGNDYDGELKTGYVGLDTWLGNRFMLGVAVARSQGTGDWRTGATSGALETRLVAVHPYLQWTSGATSIWAMAGAGRGDADNVRDGSGLAETSDLGLRMGLVELRRRLAAGGGFSLALRADAGWAELQTETGSETLDGQTAAVDQVRFGAELSQQIRLGGLTLNPFGEAHVRRDGGAGQPGTGLELIGGLKAWAGFLRLDAQGRMLAVHSATGYEEQGFSATVSLGGQGGTGPSLSVSPRWGDLASGGGDALWQEQVYSRYAAAPTAAPSADAASLAARDPWAVDVRGGYGIRIPGNHLLTWSGSVNHSPLGPRFTTGLQLSFAGSPKATRPATQPVP